MSIIDPALSLHEIVSDFAAGIRLADLKRPVARSARSEREYQPGLGPFTESETIKLVMSELEEMLPERYGHYCLEVKYPASPRNRCDICLGIDPDWNWAIEVKMLRMMGDNGRPNDNMVMHILSPYPEHRSALSDCSKLRASGLFGRKAMLIYAYDYDTFPIEPLISAFETLSGLKPANRATACVDNLSHPVHCRAVVCGWDLDL